jgi:hypothetical protein
MPVRDRADMALTLNKTLISHVHLSGWVNHPSTMTKKTHSFAAQAKAVLFDLTFICLASSRRSQNAAKMG